MLYHRLTPFFVLFCNVVASSDERDFPTLKCVTERVEALANLSSSIPKLKSLFKSFIELCKGFVPEAKKRKVRAAEADEGLVYLQHHVATPQPPVQIANEFPGSYSEAGTFSIPQLTSAPLASSDTAFNFSTEGTPGLMDLNWGLFDVQPALDWMDADFLYFDA